MFGKIIRVFLTGLLVMAFSTSFCTFANVATAMAQATTIALPPTQDTFIQHNYPYFDPFHHPSCYNYGASGVIDTASDSQSNHPRTLIQFDVSSIPHNAVITSAQLKLCSREAGVWKIIGCYPLTHSWVEGTMFQLYDPPQQIANGVSWNAYNGVDSWTTPGGDYAQYLLDEVIIQDASDVGWKSWDVTPAVEAWVNRSWPNCGLILLTTACGNYRATRFYSKEYTDSTYWPRLEVAYAVPEPPSPPPDPLIENFSVSSVLLNPYARESKVEISYELKEESWVETEIYNTDGDLVKKLYEGTDEGGPEQPENEKEQNGEIRFAGVHTINWCGVIDFPEMHILDKDKGVLLAPDGEYTVRVTAKSRSTGEHQSVDKQITVDGK